MKALATWSRDFTYPDGGRRQNTASPGEQTPTQAGQSCGLGFGCRRAASLLWPRHGDWLSPTAPFPLRVANSRAVRNTSSRRGRATCNALLQQGHRHSHSVPSVKVMIVSGPPTLKYAQALIATPRAAAFSTTIKLATDPSTMKFPASVDAIAMTSQAVR
jgi:hypothetical protein